MSRGTWNYRAVRHSHKNPDGGISEWVGLHEVYYTRGNVDGWALEVMAAESKEELIEKLEIMLKDVKNHDVIELPEDEE